MVKSNAFITADSHGKIILMGEHAVVYGSYAVALPFTANKVKVSGRLLNNKEVQELTNHRQVLPLEVLDNASLDSDLIKVEFTVEEMELIRHIYIESRVFNGSLMDAPLYLLHLTKLIVLVIKDLGADPEGLHLIINSNLPLQRGLGSSAAVAVALIRCLFKLFQVELNDAKLLALADYAENIAHGRSSGVDARATASSLPLVFSKSTGFKTLDFKLNAYLVIADSGIHGQTKEAVMSIAADLEHKQGLIDQLSACAEEFLQTLPTANLPALGTLMNDAQSLLKALGVSHPRLEELISAACQAGAIGAKLTGGGLGGCIIALCPNQLTANKVADVLQRQTGLTFIQPL